MSERLDEIKRRAAFGFGGDIAWLVTELEQALAALDEAVKMLEEDENWWAGRGYAPDDDWTARMLKLSAPLERRGWAIGAVGVETRNERPK